MKWRHVNAIPRMCEGWLLFFPSPSSLYRYLNSFGETFSFHTRARLRVCNKHYIKTFFPSHSHIFMFENNLLPLLPIWLITLRFMVENVRCCAHGQGKQWAVWNLMKLRDRADDLPEKMLLAAAVNCYDNRVIYIQISGGAGALLRNKRI